MMNIWYKIKDFYYNLKGYLKNIIKWSTILWKDRDWDSWYIFNTLEFKIKNTRDYIKLNERFVGWEHCVQKMDLTINLIDKIKEEYYCLEYFDYYSQDYYFVPYKNDLSELKWKETTKNELHLYFEKYKNIYKKFKDNDSDLQIAIKIGAHNHQRAKRILFELLNREIEKWWD